MPRQVSVIQRITADTQQKGERRCRHFPQVTATGEAGQDWAQIPQVFPLETCACQLATGVNSNQQLEPIGNPLTATNTNTKSHY